MSQSNAYLTRFAEWDRRTTARLNIATSPGIRRTLAVIITHSGDGLIPILLFGLLIGLGSPAWKTRGIAFLAADIAAFVVVHILKYTIKRPRPEGEWGQMYRKIDPHSFPSGHAGRGGALMMMGLVAGPLWLSISLLIWGVLVALSRVLMGVHFASDALVGFFTGLLSALVVALILF